MKPRRGTRRWPRRFVRVVYWLSALGAPISAGIAVWAAGADWEWWPRGVAICLTLVSLIAKAVGDSLAKAREQTLTEARLREQRRTAQELCGLALALSKTMDSDSSGDREERCVAAAERIVVSLLHDTAPEARSCFYRLQHREEWLSHDDSDDTYAFLERVGAPEGRAVHTARQTFTFDLDEDPQALETVRTILADRPMYVEDTHPRLTGKSYACFLAVPVRFKESVIGMITVDAPEPGAITLDSEYLLRTVGDFAALALNRNALAVEDEGELGRGIGAFVPGPEHWPWLDINEEEGDRGDR